MRLIIIIAAVLGGAYVLLADDVKSYVAQLPDGNAGFDLAALIKQGPLTPQTQQQRQAFTNISNWARLAVEEIGYISYRSVKEDVAKSRVFFTHSGWNKYLSAIEEVGLLSHLRKNKVTQILRVTGEPQLYEYAVEGGFNRAVIAVPAQRITAGGSGQFNKEEFDIFLYVLNSGASSEYVPYGIEQIIFWGK